MSHPSEYGSSGYNEIQNPPKRYTVINRKMLLDKELSPEYLLGKTTRLDILAETSDGTLINIEVQIADEYNIDKRILYYWARLYSGQIDSGGKYQKLNKTVSIVVMGFNWFKDDERHHRSFRIRDDQTNEIFCDLLEIHIMEVKKLRKIPAQPGDALVDWMIFFNNIGGGGNGKNCRKEFGHQESIKHRRAN